MEQVLNEILQKVVVQEEQVLDRISEQGRGTGMVGDLL